jgi:hypothetical protein
MTNDEGCQTHVRSPAGSARELKTCPHRVAGAPTGRRHRFRSLDTVTEDSRDQQICMAT